jgi:ribosomal protein S18 acetylase RimI-like enzyme
VPGVPTSVVAQKSAIGLTARSLTPDDVSLLRLSTPRAAMELREALASRPQRSVWIPDTLEYAIVGSWRNRDDISSIDEVVAVRGFEALMHAALERCVDRGDRLLLAIELEGSSYRSRYERTGMEMIEEVITYEIGVGSVPRMPQRHLRLERVALGDIRSLEIVASIDAEAFPWLWRNSQAEFNEYLGTPDVSLSLLRFDGAPVAYIGATLFTNWGHIDRIAVRPELQGNGFARAALILAINNLRQQGASRVGLSTQKTNLRSQRLYEHFGFRRTLDLDYRLFGNWIGPNSRDMG